jgi:hypothetical protein
VCRHDAPRIGGGDGDVEAVEEEIAHGADRAGGID